MILAVSFVPCTVMDFHILKLSSFLSGLSQCKLRITVATGCSILNVLRFREMRLSVFLCLSNGKGQGGNHKQGVEGHLAIPCTHRAVLVASHGRQK